MKKKTVRKVEFLLHIVTASLLLLKGYLLVVGHLYFPGAIVLALGVSVLIVMLFWRFLRITPKEARVACYYIEMPALFIIAYALYLEGKEFAPYIFFIAALLYPMAGFISSKKFKRLKKSQRR